MDNKSRTAIITGGTSGIGFETAKQFLENGYRVCVCSNDRDSIVEAAMNELREMGEALFRRTDISSYKECCELIDAAIEAYGSVEALVNVAGINESHEFLEGMLDETRKIIEVNLVGTFNMCLAAAKCMANQKSGVIINVSSVCSHIADNCKVGYHASKAGISRVTQVFAHELGPYNVRCMSVAPGWVNTRLMPQEDTAFAAGAKLHMHGRILAPKEIANVLYFLAQDEAYAINGTQVYADDGYSGYKMMGE